MEQINMTYEEVIQNVKKYGYKPPTKGEMYKFDLSGHWYLWNWLYEHLDKYKYECPIITLRPVELECFACDYLAKNYTKIECEHCPLEWPGDVFCTMNDSLYDEYCDSALNSLERKEIIKQIRDLKVKEGVEFR